MRVFFSSRQFVFRKPHSQHFFPCYRVYSMISFFLSLFIVDAHPLSVCSRARGRRHPAVAHAPVAGATRAAHAAIRTLHGVRGRCAGMRSKHTLITANRPVGSICLYIPFRFLLKNKILVRLRGYFFTMFSTTLFSLSMFHMPHSGSFPFGSRTLAVGPPDCAAPSCEPNARAKSRWRAARRPRPRCSATGAACALNANSRCFALRISASAPPSHCSATGVACAHSVN